MKPKVSNPSPTTQRGFTLVEIAIVLMIIGLLIGGIMRGQELITSARVRNMIDQKTSIQVAQIAFMDRYRMTAGDLTQLQVAEIGLGTLNANYPGNGVVEWDDGIRFFQNLTSTGFLACSNCNGINDPKTGTGFATPENSLLNPYGAPVWFFTYGGNSEGDIFYLLGGDKSKNLRPALGTGSNVPMQVMAELDRKADDGNPTLGILRFSTQTGTGVPNPDIKLASCMNVATANLKATWKAESGGNCGGAWLF